jgi:hypothetical protein
MRTPPKLVSISGSFNSLSRDHKATEAVAGVPSTFAYSTFNSLSRDHRSGEPALREGALDFQLPLSGSPLELIGFYRDLDLSTPSLGITTWTMREWRLKSSWLSTPSLGITVADEGEGEEEEKEKLSTPSLGITGKGNIDCGRVGPFNSLSRDHDTGPSPARTEATSHFQLPLSGSPT